MYHYQYYLQGPGVLMVKMLRVYLVLQLAHFATLSGVQVSHDGIGGQATGDAARPDGT